MTLSGNIGPFRGLGTALGWTLVVWGMTATVVSAAGFSSPKEFPPSGREALATGARPVLAQWISRAETAVPARSEVPGTAVELGQQNPPGTLEKTSGFPEPPAARENEVAAPPESGVASPDSGLSTDIEPTPFPREASESGPQVENPRETVSQPASSGAGTPAAPNAMDPETVPAEAAIPSETGPAVADEPSVEIPPLVEYDAGRLSVRAEGEPLGDVLRALRESGGVRVNGLEPRADEPLFFQVEWVPVEDGLKRLMRHLKASNYAFEYSRTRLRRISVFPAGQTERVSRAPAPTPLERPENADRERAVRVINVHEGTQAENLDLQKGDLIVEYDGQAITSAQQLVDAVKARSAEQIVQMTVVREGNRFPLTLNGGLIGINILTVNVPVGELGR